MIRQVVVGFHRLEGKHYRWVRRKTPVAWTRPTTGNPFFNSRPGPVRTQQHSLDAPRVIRARQGWPKWFNWPHWKNI